MNTLFPIFLKLENLQTLIVGGGNVGLEKLEALLKNAPLGNYTLVAPLVKEEIKELSKQEFKLTIKERKFEWGDLNDIDIIICATDDKELHQQIVVETRKRRLLINVADTPDLCDFYLSSVVTKGDLKIAISTNGKSPTFAKRFKEMLNELIDSDDINVLLGNLNKYRDSLKGNFNEKVKAMNQITQQLFSKS